MIATSLPAFAFAPDPAVTGVIEGAMNRDDIDARYFEAALRAVRQSRRPGENRRLNHAA